MFVGGTQSGRKLIELPSYLSRRPRDGEGRVP